MACNLPAAHQSLTCIIIKGANAKKGRTQCDRAASVEKFLSVVSQWSGPFSWWIPVSIAVFVTSIVAMTVSVLATGEAVSVAAHCSKEVENIHKVHMFRNGQNLQ